MNVISKSVKTFSIIINGSSSLPTSLLLCLSRLSDLASTAPGFFQLNNFSFLCSHMPRYRALKMRHKLSMSFSFFRVPEIADPQTCRPRLQENSLQSLDMSCESASLLVNLPCGG